VIDVILLGPGEEARLDQLLSDVFDGPIRESRVTEFLDDSRHHLAVAVDGDLVAGFASAVHYVHPDKDPELWINEVGVASQYRRRGVARALVRRLFQHATQLGCSEAWVLTERDNEAAMGLYRSLRGVTADAETVMFSFDVRDSE
jgi:aminoglycoside 6'-N-acetyltransferase I